MLKIDVVIFLLVVRIVVFMYRITVFARFVFFPVYYYNLFIHRVIVKLYTRPALMSVCSSGTPPSVNALV